MFPGAQAAHLPPLDDYADNNFGLAPLPQKIEHKPSVIRSSAVPVEDEPPNDDYHRLTARLRTYGLKEHVVRGDGNCQFRALADQFFNDVERHAEVRRRVIGQLRARPDDYSMFVPDDYSVYVNKMALDGTWGDHLTLQAAADAYGTRLCVITSYEESFLIEITPKKQKSRKVVWLSFWAEVHYNSIKPDDQAHNLM